MPTRDLLARTAAVLEEQGVLQARTPMVVGVSGGVDSMVLLDLLVRLDRPLHAAHVQYGLRGEASAADEALVRERCAALGVPLEVARYDTKALAREEGESVQSIARALRYRFFRELAAKRHASAVAVAHHADDQAETVLLHLFRGTGIEGLAGMPVVRPLAPDEHIVLIRPLLMVRRDEIFAYARERAVPWREDASNRSSEYRRSVIRTGVLPLVEEAFGGDVRDRIARTASFVRTYLGAAYEPELQSRFHEAAVPNEGAGLLRDEVLRTQPEAWRARLVLHALERWLPRETRSALVAARLLALLDAQVGRKAILKEGVVWRERGGLLFLPQAPAGLPVERAEIPLAEGEYPVPGGTLDLTRTMAPIMPVSEDPSRATMDAIALQAPLVVRCWRAGDRIQPLGMTGHKKVSDLLTDAQVPVHRRDRAVVVESAGAIVWVPGVRLAHHVRVRANTAEAWCIHYRRS